MQPTLQPTRARVTETPPKITDLPRHFPPPPNNDDEISILELFQILAKQKTIILATTLASLLLAGFYLLSAKDIYRAETTLTPTLVTESKSNALLQQLGGIANIPGISGFGQNNSTNNTAMALAILESRTFSDSFIQDQKLLDALTNNNNDPLQTPLTAAQKKWGAYKQLDSIRKTSVNHNNGIITLSIEWHDPQQAADWTNSLVTQLNKHLQTSAIREAENSIAYLNEQLQKTSVIELQGVLNRLVEGQVKKITLANVNEQYAFKVIDPAITPLESISPQRRLIIILSIIGGLMLGIFLAFIANFINKLKTSNIT